MKSIRSWLNIRVILGGILFAVIVFTVLVGILWLFRAEQNNQAPSTAIVRIIEVPTITPTAPTRTTTTPDIVSSQQAPPPAGNISIGDFVQISGTGGDGLRLHESAGVSTKVQYVALEAEVFTIKDGPVDADGYVWWLLEDPYNQNAAGWGVANYLAIVQNP